MPYMPACLCIYNFIYALASKLVGWQLGSQAGDMQAGKLAVEWPASAGGRQGIYTGIC